MKKKTLSLRKEVIADLSNQEMAHMIGGGTDGGKSCPCHWEKAGPEKKTHEESVFACAMPPDTKTYLSNCEFSGAAKFGCPPPLEGDLVNW